MLPKVTFPRPNILTAIEILDLVQYIPIHAGGTNISHSIPKSHFYFPLKCPRKENSLYIPSSLEHNSPLMPGWSNSDPISAASVAYELRCKVRCAGILMGEVTRKLCIFDYSDSTPPICVEDFESEYCLSTTISIRRRIFQQIATIAFNSIQPSPLVFTAGADSASTEIPISAVLRSNAKASELINELNYIEVSVLWKLQTSTFVSISPLNSHPTISEALESRSLVRLVKTSKTTEYKTYWTDWCSLQPSKRFDIDEDLDFTSKQTIRISLTSSSLLVPTTSLPNIFRRYCILLQLKFRYFGQSSSMLKLPVQILYRSQPAKVSEKTAAPSHSS